MSFFKKGVLTARPVSVSYVTEVVDEDGFYMCESKVIACVCGNCVGRPMLGGETGWQAPKARGGRIAFMSYAHDSDRTIIDYRFGDTLFRNRFKTSERFRNKLLKQIAKYQNENIK